ncbi:cytochrome P450 [Amycolatopsis sp. NBC_00345]|uniref:cytochrome P450 n=1 Tax=Amycolatopsis sp. NBC_00345 TaxID=2975955 RepID=UPI002E256110
MAQLLGEMAERKVEYDPGLSAVFVYGYDEVRALLTSPSLQNARLRDPLAGATEEQRALHGPVRAFFGRWPVFSDGDYHTRLRRLLMPPLRAAAVEDVLAELRVRCGELLRELATRPGVDFVTDFAIPYVHHALELLLGVTTAELAALVEPADRLMDYLATPKVSENAEVGHAARRSLTTFTEAVRRSLLGKPRSPLARALTEVDGELGLDAAVASAAQIITGTIDPTTTALSDAVLHWAALDAPESSTVDADRFTAESLRLSCPFIFAPRSATEAMRIGDVTAEWDTKVMLVLAAANMDATRYGEPGALRAGGRDTPSLTFGLGEHYCLGAPLARGMIAALVETLRDGEVHLEVDAGTLRRRGAVHGTARALAARITTRTPVREASR